MILGVTIVNGELPLVFILQNSRSSRSTFPSFNRKLRCKHPAYYNLAFTKIHYPITGISKKGKQTVPFLWNFFNWSERVACATHNTNGSTLLYTLPHIGFILTVWALIPYTTQHHRLSKMRPSLWRDRETARVVYRICWL